MCIAGCSTGSPDGHSCALETPAPSAPTSTPTSAPTHAPTPSPTTVPTAAPTAAPTIYSTHDFLWGGDDEAQKGLLPRAKGTLSSIAGQAGTAVLSRDGTRGDAQFDTRGRVGGQLFLSRKKAADDSVMVRLLFVEPKTGRLRVVNAGTGEVTTLVDYSEWGLLWDESVSKFGSPIQITDNKGHFVYSILPDDAGTGIHVYVMQVVR